MKIRNNNSKAFHKNQDSNKIKKNKALSTLLSKINNNNNQNILNDQKQQINAFKKIISNCYNNRSKQQQLCALLKVPFVPGPITLNSIPDSFFTEEYLVAEDNRQQSILNQLNYLFDYLKKTKQYYYCWIIYYNQELKILTIKMMKKFELEQNIQLLNKEYCLIGIFVDRQVHTSKNNQQNSQFIINHDRRKKMSNKFNSMSYSQKAFVKNSQNFSQKSIQNTKTTIISKVKQRDTLQSFKYNKSQSKTNSSSFQKQNFYKTSGDISKFNQTTQLINTFQKQNKRKNFKKKKNNIIMNAKSHIQENKTKCLSKNMGIYQLNSKLIKAGDNLSKQVRSVSRFLSPNNHSNSTLAIKIVKQKILPKNQIKNFKIHRSISSKIIKNDNKQINFQQILSPQKKKTYKFQ